MPNTPSINFYYQSSEFYEAIFSAIKNAQKSVLIESYIFEYFQSTKVLIDLLISAMNSGLEVKIIFDGFGCLPFLNKHLAIIEKNNIPYRIFNPVPFLFNRWSFSKYALTPLNILRIGNRRNHRKLVIIDEKRVFIGSQNWAHQHVYGPSVTIPWQDIGCQIENEDVSDLLRSFRQVWKVSRNKNFYRPFKGFVRLKNHNPFAQNFKLNFSFLQRYRINKHLIKSIRTAQKKIIIGSAYFLPKKSFIRALKKAKKRGVEIKIITSGPTDVKIVKLASLELYEKLLKNNIPIFEYVKSHFHSKYFLFDDKSILIGSYNMNHRSLMHDLEILYEINDAVKVKEFRGLIQRDITDSIEISLEDIKNRPWYVKLISKILYRMRYIL